MVCKPIAVRCIYQADGATVENLILEAFRMFVERELRKMSPERL